MSTKELKDELLRELGLKLKEFGFKKKGGEQSFRRDFDGGWNSVHLAFIDYDVYVDVTMGFSVRFHQVEELVNEANHLLKPKEKKSTATIGMESGNLSAGKPRWWTVRSVEDVPSVIESMYDQYRKVGEPYLSRYNTLESAYELLTSEKKQDWMHAPIHDSRSKRIIAMAKLLGHSDIEQQIAKQKAILEDLKDPRISSFVAFAEGIL